MRSLGLLLLIAAACRSDDKPARKRPPPAPVAAPVAPAEPRPPAGPRPSLDARAFDRGCAADTDCVVVKAALCDPCGCSVDAIASSAMAAFDEAGGKLACPPPDLDVKCAPCPTRVATCADRQCVAK